MRSRGRRDERVTYLWADLKQSVRVYSARTAQTSAAYLTPCLQPGMSLIDLGCGPGSVTADLADLVAPGRVVGIDISPKMIRRARAAAAGRSVANLSFAVADALSLPVPDGCFDVVHFHQLLLHVPDPVGVLREMRRAAVPGGLVAARAGDIEAIVFFPDCPAAANSLRLLARLARTQNVEHAAGRRLLRWMREAGFSDVAASASAECATGPDAIPHAEAWAARLSEPVFIRQATQAGLATAAEIAHMAQAWHEWSRAPDAWYTIVHAEVLATA